METFHFDFDFREMNCQIRNFLPLLAKLNIKIII
jgi:hypothetical protein